MFGSPIGLSPILLRRRRHRLAQQKYELYLNICDWGNLNHSLISCKHSAVQGSKDGWCKLLICISYISMNTCNFSFILKSSFWYPVWTTCRAFYPWMSAFFIWLVLMASVASLVLMSSVVWSLSVSAGCNILLFCFSFYHFFCFCFVWCVNRQLR